MATLDTYYLDISKIGRDFTGNKDIALLTNERAVAESVHNLLNTQPGQRIMNPEFGTDLEQYLFMPLDPITSLQIRKEIEDAIERFEPRVENVEVIVIEDEENQTFDVTVTFSIKVINTQQTIQFTLIKVR